MKSLNHILEAVYCQPWLISASAHKNIREQLEAVIEGKMQMPSIDNDDDSIYDTSPQIVSPNLALICIDGIIGKHLGLMDSCLGAVDLDNVNASLDEAANDPQVDTICLYINSAGGSVIGVPETAAKIAEIAKTKTVLAYTDMLCCSAAYYLASQCSAFYCAPSSRVVNIGTYAVYLDQSVALANEGVTVNAIVGNNAKYKLAGAPFKQMTVDERAMLQANMDKIDNAFKAAVKSNRDVSDDDMQGQVFDGEDAVEKNFADGNYDSLEEMLNHVSEGKAN